jgi:histidine triad (HIT) family protein
MCLFCDIINKKIPAKIIDESPLALAFMDINPISDGHILVIPKKHCQCFSDCENEYLIGVINMVKKIAQAINNSKLKPWGINYLSNEGKIAGQEIFHFHIHIIPKYSTHEGLTFNSQNKCIKPIDQIYDTIIQELKTHNYNATKKTFSNKFRPILMPAFEKLPREEDKNKKQKK